MGAFLKILEFVIEKYYSKAGANFTATESGPVFALLDFKVQCSKLVVRLNADQMSHTQFLTKDHQTIWCCATLICFLFCIPDYSVDRLGT